MNMEIGTERKPRLFYGWWIVLAGFLVVAYGTFATGYVTRTNFIFKLLGSKTDHIFRRFGYYVMGDRAFNRQIRPQETHARWYSGSWHCPPGTRACR